MDSKGISSIIWIIIIAVLLLGLFLWDPLGLFKGDEDGGDITKVGVQGATVSGDAIKKTINQHLQGEPPEGEAPKTGMKIEVVPEPFAPGKGRTTKIYVFNETSRQIGGLPIFLADEAGNLRHNFPTIGLILPQNSFVFEWDGADESGELFEQGTYFVVATGIRGGEDVVETALLRIVRVDDTKDRDALIAANPWPHEIEVGLTPNKQKIEFKEYEGKPLFVVNPTTYTLPELGVQDPEFSKPFPKDIYINGFRQDRRSEAEKKRIKVEVKDLEGDKSEYGREPYTLVVSLDYSDYFAQKNPLPAKEEYVIQFKVPPYPDSPEIKIKLNLNESGVILYKEASEGTASLQVEGKQHLGVIRLEEEGTLLKNLGYSYSGPKTDLRGWEKHEIQNRIKESLEDYNDDFDALQRSSEDYFNLITHDREHIPVFYKGRLVGYANTSQYASVLRDDSGKTNCMLGYPSWGEVRQVAPDKYSEGYRFGKEEIEKDEGTSDALYNSVSEITSNKQKQAFIAGWMDGGWDTLKEREELPEDESEQFEKYLSHYYTLEAFFSATHLNERILAKVSCNFDPQNIHLTLREIPEEPPPRQAVDQIIENIAFKKGWDILPIEDKDSLSYGEPEIVEIEPGDPYPFVETEGDVLGNRAILAYPEGEDYLTLDTGSDNVIQKRENESGVIDDGRWRYTIKEIRPDKAIVEIEQSLSLQQEIQNLIKQEYERLDGFTHLLIIGSHEDIPLFDGEGLALDSAFYGNMDDDAFAELSVGRLPMTPEEALEYYDNLELAPQEAYKFFMGEEKILEQGFSNMSDEESSKAYVRKKFLFTGYTPVFSGNPTKAGEFLVVKEQTGIGDVDLLDYFAAGCPDFEQLNPKDTLSLIVNPRYCVVEADDSPMFKDTKTANLIGFSKEFKGDDEAELSGDELLKELEEKQPLQQYDLIVQKKRKVTIGESFRDYLNGTSLFGAEVETPVYYVLFGDPSNIVDLTKLQPDPSKKAISTFDTENNKLVWMMPQINLNELLARGEIVFSGKDVENIEGKKFLFENATILEKKSPFVTNLDFAAPDTSNIKYFLDLMDTGTEPIELVTLKKIEQAELNQKPKTIFPGRFDEIDYAKYDGLVLSVSTLDESNEAEILEVPTTWPKEAQGNNPVTEEDLPEKLKEKDTYQPGNEYYHERVELKHTSGKHTDFTRAKGVISVFEEKDDKVSFKADFKKLPRTLTDSKLMQFTKYNLFLENSDGQRKKIPQDVIPDEKENASITITNLSLEGIKYETIKLYGVGKELFNKTPILVANLQDGEMRNTSGFLQYPKSSVRVDLYYAKDPTTKPNLYYRIKFNDVKPFFEGGEDKIILLVSNNQRPEAVESKNAVEKILAKIKESSADKKARIEELEADFKEGEGFIALAGRPFRILESLFAENTHFFGNLSTLNPFNYPEGVSNKTMKEAIDATKKADAVVLAEPNPISLEDDDVVFIGQGENKGVKYEFGLKELFELMKAGFAKQRYTIEVGPFEKNIAVEVPEEGPDGTKGIRGPQPDELEVKIEPTRVILLPSALAGKVKLKKEAKDGINDRFSEGENNTVVDKEQGLEWTKKALIDQSFPTAKDYCLTIERDWRLPAAAELKSLAKPATEIYDNTSLFTDNDGLKWLELEDPTVPDDQSTFFAPGMYPIFEGEEFTLIPPFDFWTGLGTVVDFPLTGEAAEHVEQPDQGNVHTVCVRELGPEFRFDETSAFEKTMSMSFGDDETNFSSQVKDILTAENIPYQKVTWTGNLPIFKGTTVYIYMLPAQMNRVVDMVEEPVYSREEADLAVTNKILEVIGTKVEGRQVQLEKPFG